eukprot:6483642-Amphidinium_carterae.1
MWSSDGKMLAATLLASPAPSPANGSWRLPPAPTAGGHGKRQRRLHASHRTRHRLVRAASASRSGSARQCGTCACTT